MNENVKAFLRQSTEQVPGEEGLGGYHWGEELNTDLFAQLIVKKCIDICQTNEKQLQNLRMGLDDFNEKNIIAQGEHTAMKIAAEIRAYFGVD